MGSIQKADNVFVNCPFDSTYKDSLFRAIIFTVFDCGFVPRCALEVEDSAEVRIDKIYRIIQESKYGIHDISRTEVNEEGLPRFNMPFELGLFLGAKRFGFGPQKEKKCLVIDTEKYRYQKFLSDISGQDIKSHKGDILTCIGVIRGWLNSSSGRKTLPGGKDIHRRFELFLYDLPDILSEMKVESEEVTYNDFANIVSNWLREQD